MTCLLAVVMTTLASPDLANAPIPLPFLSEVAPGFDLAPAAADGPPPEELDKWKGSVTVGVTYADGNTNRKTGSATANVSKRREKDRTTFGFLWNYAKEDGTTTDRRTIATAKYDYFLSKKAYALAQASAEGDLAAQLELRAIVGVGAGYQFVEDEKWKLSGEAGLSYVDENYKDNTADADFIAARFAYNVDYKPNDTWQVGQTGEIYPSLEDTDDVSARVDTHGKLMLTKSMLAQLQWLFSWDNTPATGAERADNLVLLTVGWSF
jgi:putative salt-induced outer membrane protein YdiY